MSLSNNGAFTCECPVVVSWIPSDHIELLATRAIDVNATICLFLAATLHCQDVSESGIFNRSLPVGEGARLCITGTGYYRCQNVSQEDGYKLIRQHECNGWRSLKETKESNLKFAGRQAEHHRELAAKWPKQSKLFKEYEERYRLEAAGHRYGIAEASQRIEKWCTD